MRAVCIVEGHSNQVLICWSGHLEARFFRSVESKDHDTSLWETCSCSAWAGDMLASKSSQALEKEAQDAE
jgi:hypothetical protein